MHKECQANDARERGHAVFLHRKTFDPKICKSDSLLWFVSELGDQSWRTEDLIICQPTTLPHIAEDVAPLECLLGRKSGW